jgi:hypothetical protein
VDGKTGFALSYYAIYKTTDAGQTWKEIDPHTPVEMFDMVFTDKNTGYIIGDSGLLLKTTTGGVSGIITPEPAQPLLVYPNPSNGIFYLQSDKIVGTLEIYDGLGHLVLRKVAGNGTQIDLSRQPKGVYYYRIIGTTTHSGKLVRN